MKKIALAIVVASLVAACGSQEVKKDVPVADRTTPTTQPSRPATSTTTSPTTQPAIAANPLTDPKNILSKRSVYFDFDSNVVKDEFRPVVQAHARYMVEKKDAKIRVEGNCDERGSREYNLALGQRRADAIKNHMINQGVAPSRLAVVSYGEEKPLDPGSNERAWAQNRRAEFIITWGDAAAVGSSTDNK